MTSRRRVFPIMIGLAVSAPARAQVPATAPSPTARERAEILFLQPAAHDPTATSPLSVPDPQLALEASREAKEITARIGIQRGDWGVDLKIKGPIGEAQPQAPLVGLDGFPQAGVSMDLGATWTIWKVVPAPAAVTDAICERNNRGLSVAEIDAAGGSLLEPTSSVVGWSDFAKALDGPVGQALSAEVASLAAPMAHRPPPLSETDKAALVKVVDAALKQEATILRLAALHSLRTPQLTMVLALAQRTPAETAYANRQLLELALPRGPQGSLLTIRPAGPPCQASRLTKPNREAYLRSFNVGQPFQIGARVKASRADFTFVTEELLDAMKHTTTADAIEVLEKTHHSASVTIAGGLLTKSRRLLAAGFTYQSSYKAATDPVDVCREIRSTEAAACRSVTLGEPTKESKSIAYVEYRQRVSTGFGIAPQLYMDVKNERLGLNVPLYFLKTGTGLGGGISLKWEDNKKFVAALFVGNVFDFENPL